jgi:hypothetical protein
MVIGISKEKFQENKISTMNLLSKRNAIISFFIYLKLMAIPFIIPLFVNPIDARRIIMEFDWHIFIPVFLILLIFSIVFFLKNIRQFKKNYLGILAILPVLIHFFYFAVKLILQFIFIQ